MAPLAPPPGYATEWGYACSPNMPVCLMLECIRLQTIHAERSSGEIPDPWQSIAQPPRRV